MDTIQKIDRANKRQKYLRTDKSNKKAYNGCSCSRCNLQLSKKIYNEKQLKRTTVELNKCDYSMCEFI